MQDDFSGVDAIIENARKPIVLFMEGMPYSFIPNEYKMQDLEKLLPAPTRKRAEISLTDSASFIAYAVKHGHQDTCLIYADSNYVSQTAKFIAIINDHGGSPENAAWRDHTATLTPIKTVEWCRWATFNGKTMGQAEFANFIEDNLSDIASVEGMPTGTEMLSMALDFEAKADKRFKQKLNIQGGGIQLEFIDDEDKDTRSKMKVFERFALGIRVFLNGDAYQLQAKLRYRQKDEKLTFWYELIRPDRVFEKALGDEIKKIQDGTGFMILNGNPNL